MWCLQALYDGSVASGDSLGHVQIWDGTHGTLLHSFQSHRADVLSLVEDAKNHAIFAAGIDHKVVMFQWVQTQSAGGASSGGKWIYSCHRRQHTHDIRTLTVAGDVLVSGGVDTQLCMYSTSKFEQASKPAFKLMPFPETSCIAVSRATKRLLARHAHSVELWQLGVAEVASVDVVEGAQLATEQSPTRLLELQASSGSVLRCSALSKDSTHIAYADMDDVKLFQVQYSSSGAVVAVHERGPPTGLHSSVLQLAFTSQSLLCATIDGTIQVVDLESNAVVHTLDHRQGEAPVPLTTLAVSADEQWLASGDGANGIRVFNLDTMQHHVKLPAFDSVHTALSFHLASSVLVVACWSGFFYLYNVEERELQEYTTSNCNQIPKQQLRGRPRLIGVSFNPANPDTMVLFSSSFLCSVDMSKAAPEGEVSIKSGDGDNKKLKIKHHKKKDKHNAALTDNFRIVDRYRPILHMEFLDGNTMVVVERPWLQVMENFPGMLHRHRYGT